MAKKLKLRFLEYKNLFPAPFEARPQNKSRLSLEEAMGFNELN